MLFLLQQEPLRRHTSATTPASPRAMPRGNRVTGRPTHWRPCLPKQCGWTEAKGHPPAHRQANYEQYARQQGPRWCPAHSQPAGNPGIAAQPQGQLPTRHGHKFLRQTAEAHASHEDGQGACAPPGRSNTAGLFPYDSTNGHQCGRLGVWCRRANLVSDRRAGRPT